MRIAPDDLTPGMFVTVMETETPKPSGHPSAAVPQQATPSKDYTGAGAVLRVLSVSYPFVLVQNMAPAMLRAPRMFPLDLRRTSLMLLGDDYVRAALGDPPPVDEAVSSIDAEVIDDDEPEHDETTDTPAGEQSPPGKHNSSSKGDDDFGGGIFFLGG